MTLTIYIYFDTEKRESALRKAKKYKKYDIKEEENCIILTKVI
jgi:hypothetical protein